MSITLSPEQTRAPLRTHALGNYAKALESDHPGQRYCGTCKQLRPLEEFFVKGTKQLPTRGGRHCYLCRSSNGKTFERGRKRLLDAASNRARRFGLPFDLKREDIVIPEKCPVLGIPLKFGSRIQRDNSPSIDRLSEEGGYVRGNIIIVSWKANNIKRNFSWEELLIVGNFYKKLLQHETAL